jgi:hypothetical protein
VIDRKLSIEDAVRLVGEVAKPTSPWEWEGRPVGDFEFPALCRFCGDALTIEIIGPDGLKGARVRVSHDMPICADFARYVEEH